MTAPAPERPLAGAALAEHFDSLQQAQPVADGRLAEQRHWLDADPDTRFPTPGVAHPKTGDAR